jgi:sugar lactone lactonase YvrE
MRVIGRLAGSAALLALLAACDTRPFDVRDGSGGECSNDPGSTCTWAGVPNARGFNGDGRALTESWLYFVEDLTFGPDGRAWVLDWNNHRVRRVEPDGTFRTIIGTDYEGDGPPGEIDRLPYGAPQGCPPEDVALNHPTDVRFMPDGTLVLAAWHNNKLRVVSPTTGLLTVLAGDGYGFSGDGAAAYQVVFNQPKSLAIDPEGRIYTIDQRNERIRMIDIDAQRTTRTIAGTCVAETVGNVACEKAAQATACSPAKTTTCADVTRACADGCTPAYTGDGGPALEARFGFDSGVTPEPSGALALRGRELYVADSLNNRIREIDLDSGLIRCVVGPGCPIDAQLDGPLDLEFGPDGRLYVADRYANAIEAIDLEARQMVRVAGNGQPCARASKYCVETTARPSALELQLNEPYGLSFDALGNLYIADSHNSRIVRVAGPIR